MTYYFSRYYKFFTKLFFISLLLIGLGNLWGMARAQTQAQFAHILTTVVQLEDVTSNRGVEQMSTGVIVHQDGYILTPDTTPSINSQSRLFRVYTSSADNAPSKWRYIAVLDRKLANGLQLLKIISKQNQSPLDVNQRFDFMELAGGSQSLNVSSPLVLWAYPAGIAKFVERTTGQVTAAQRDQVFSDVRLEPGNIGGVVTTFDASGALPKLSAIALGTGANQQTLLLALRAGDQNAQSNLQDAYRSFAAPQTATANYQLERSLGFDTQLEDKIPVSYAHIDLGNARTGFDPLAFLKENPNNNINTAALQVSGASQASSAYQPSIATSFATAQAPLYEAAAFQVPVTQVPAYSNESGQNIIIQQTASATGLSTGTSSPATGQTGLVAGPTNQDIYAATLAPSSTQTSNSAQELPANANSLNANNQNSQDALLSVFSGQPQSSHVSSQEVSNFMQRAAQGGTVNLQAGVYYLPEGIELSRDVALRGAGKNQTFVIAKSGYHVIKFSGQGNFSAEGISFVYDGPSDANGLHILSGHVSLSNVRSTNTQTQVGASVSSQPMYEGSGVLLDLYVQSARIETSEFDFNPAFGVAVRGQVRPLINQNLIHHNGLAGIRFSEQSGGQVENNIIEENVYFGIDVSAVGRVQLERNSFRRNGSFGVNAIESAQVSFAENNFDANGQGQIRY